MAFPTKFKPETIERHRREYVERVFTRRSELLTNLRKKATEEGPESIWQEMADEMAATLRTENTPESKRILATVQGDNHDQ